VLNNGIVDTPEPHSDKTTFQELACYVALFGTRCGYPVSKRLGEVYMPMMAAVSKRLGDAWASKLLILANAGFWLIFCVVFVVESEPYQPHRLHFEEVIPTFIYFGRALPMQAEGTGLLLRTARILQYPSFLVAKPYFWYFNRRGFVTGDSFAKVSLGGYLLVVVCLLSFAQWYAVGFFIDWIRLHWAREVVRES
jgi:hypothetical protein